MHEVHVDPIEAIDAHCALRAEHFIGIHWGTYNLALEPFQQPPQMAAEHARSLGLDMGKIHLLSVGGLIEAG